MGLSIITRSSQCFVPFGISFLYSEIFFPFLHFSFEMLLFLFVCNYCFQKVVGMRSCTAVLDHEGRVVHVEELG